jgi:hypothetical protein
MDDNRVEESARSDPKSAVALGANIEVVIGT